MSRWLEELRADLAEQVESGEISYDDARDEYVGSVDDRMGEI